MSQTLIYTIASLSALGVILAVILYFVAQKFKVFEDPRIDEVEAVLPGANCGGCGFPGCRGFAEATTKATELTTLHCPVGGNDTMKDVASILGLEAVEVDPMIAVVRCSGSFDHRPRTNVYDGAASCTIASALYSGNTGCAYGCVGLGECVDACDFNAMYMDEKTGLPVVIEDKCTACGACVKACPKDIIELWPKGKKDRRIYVACINEDKGGTARKACEVACIGCGKCVKECKFDAITVDNFLAYIDGDLCKLCKKCVDVCPTESIVAINFPEKKAKPAKTEEAADVVAEADVPVVASPAAVKKAPVMMPKKAAPVMNKPAEESAPDQVNEVSKEEQTALAPAKKAPVMMPKMKPTINAEASSTPVAESDKTETAIPVAKKAPVMMPKTKPVIKDVAVTSDTENIINGEPKTEEQAADEPIAKKAPLMTPKVKAVMKKAEEASAEAKLETTEPSVTVPSADQPVAKKAPIMSPKMKPVMKKAEPVVNQTEAETTTEKMEKPVDVSAPSTEAVQAKKAPLKMKPLMKPKMQNGENEKQNE